MSINDTYGPLSTIPGGSEGVPPGFDLNVQGSEKSLQLLRSWLTPEQLEDLNKHGYFDVIGGTTGHRYRIRAERWYNTRRVFENGEVSGEKMCIIPEGLETLGDRMLAQKIAFETDELATLAKVNTATDHSFHGYDCFDGFGECWG